MNIIPLRKIFVGFALSAIMLPAATEELSAAIPPKITNLPVTTEGLSTPLRITGDDSGNYYISDPRGGGVLKYDQAWVFKRKISTATNPFGVAVTSTGNLLVGQGDHVSIIDSVGTETGMLGNGRGQFRKAGGITLDTEGNIYVTDTLDNCVQIFSPSGSFRSRFGSRGSDPGKMSSPSGIAFDKSSRQLAVADTLNGRIQFFDLNGNHLKTLGSLGSGPLKFTSPQNVAFEYDEIQPDVLARMYVVDSFQSTVQVVNPSGAGTFIGYVGSYGTAQGKLINPSDILFDKTSKRLVVLNSLAGTISLFGINSDVPVSPGPSLIFTVDTTPTITNNPSLVLTGTMSAGAVVTATTDNGALPGTPAYPSSGRWSLPITGMKPGLTHITVRASMNGTEYASQVVAVNLTTLSPTITINAMPRLTNIPVQLIAGTRQSTDSISISTSTNAVAGPISYPTSSTWEVTISALAPGDNVITAIATNGAGVSAASVTITLDTSPPTVALASLPQASYAAERVQNIFGATSDENIDRVTINDVPAILVGNYFTGAIVLGGGENQIKVVSYDKAGNSTTITRTLNFLVSKPPVVVTTPADITLTKAGVISISGNVDPGYTISVNGSPVTQNGTVWSTTASLNAGINTVNIAATDVQGRSYLLKRTVITTSGPDLSITGPAVDTATREGTLTVSGTTEPGSTLSYIFNSRTGSAPVVNGTFSFNLTFDNEGTYPVVITATNASGMSSTAVRTIINDQKPPALSVDLTRALTTKVVRGMTESGSTVTAEVGGTVIASAVAAADGTWSFDLTSVDYTRDNLIVKSRDAAGNIKANSLYPVGDVVTRQGEPQLADAIKMMRIANGLDRPTTEETVLGDIAPLRNGKPQPDGIIDGLDVMLVLYRLIGFVTW